MRFRKRRSNGQAALTMPTAKDQSIAVPVDLAENDPLLVYLEEASAVVEVDHIPLASPGVDALKNAGVKLVVPLIAQGQLIGVLSLGERQSGADYSTDDQRLLSNLSTDAASALRVAQLVQQQEFHARERERIDQELKIARLIQQTLLPKELPALDGWRMAAYYQPAREVGGDFYDLLALKDGRLGIVIGDVTDKGIPAALVMATTRAILRMMGQQCSSPGEVLSNANNALCPDMPRNMFVTCLYAILNPITGHLRYANAGHGAPYRRSKHGVDELMARGMPLGLMPEMQYEEQETTLKPGETVLFYSDGLIEAHNPQGQMLGFDGLQTLLATYDDNGKGQIDFLLNEMARFIGPNWEQEDDITLLSLQRFGTSSFISISHRATQEIRLATLEYRMKNQIPLGEYILSSEPGNERLAMEYVAKAVAQFNLPQDRLENLKTAVAEATTNAMEHGSGYGSGKPVTLRVRASKNSISVQILDYGKGVASPVPTTPNLDAKLAGRETPRGWGLFLIRNLVDDLKLSREGDMNSTELVLYL